jgi:hypothetical protein
MGACV